MKVRKGAVKPFTTELTSECSTFIRSLTEASSTSEFIETLDNLTEWSSAFGKTEMGRWVHVLNRCDSILEESVDDTTGSLAIDVSSDYERVVVSILKFTSLLFENCFARSVYSSMDRLIKLLESRKMHIVAHTLRLLLTVSKSSRFVSQHVSQEQRNILYTKLAAITESWTCVPKQYDMKACCARDVPVDLVSVISFRTSSSVQMVVINRKDSFEKAKSSLRLRLSLGMVDDVEKELALAKFRLAYNFSDYESRLCCVMSRLTAISVLVYSRCLLDEARTNCLINDALIEQTAAVLHLEVPAGMPAVDKVRTDALKTLTSIVFLENPRKVQLVIECLGLNTYHGYTASLVRRAVDELKGKPTDRSSDLSLSFINALFSLVCHVAGAENYIPRSSQSPLSACSLVKYLLDVVRCYSLPDSQMSVVTRAVRIIDTLTGFNAAEFNSNDGMTAIVDRFVHEMKQCGRDLNSSTMSASTVCHQQRSALIKSLLNLLKRTALDASPAAQVTRISVMEGDLPNALAHVINNPHYYGSSLVYCAIQLTTRFIYQEPAQLTTLQDKGLTGSLHKALFNDKFAATRDIIINLPSICSALCLNERGLNALSENLPFERIFHILFSTKFISVMRKRKGELVDAAGCLGGSFHELMRRQPTLRKDLVDAFVKVLDEIVSLGSQPNVRCTMTTSFSSKWTLEEDDLPGVDDETNPAAAAAPPDQIHEDDASEDEPGEGQTRTSEFSICHIHDDLKVLPLGDYLGVIGKMLEAILVNSSVSDTGTAMVEGDVPRRLVQLLTLGKPHPALLQSTYLQSLASILRSLVQHANGTAPFEFLVAIIMTKFREYQALQKNTQTELYTKARAGLLIHLNALVIVLAHFFQHTALYGFDVRAPLLNFMANVEEGRAFVIGLFEGYRDLNLDLSLIIGQQKETQQVEHGQTASCTASTSKEAAPDSSGSRADASTTDWTIIGDGTSVGAVPYKKKTAPVTEEEKKKAHERAIQSLVTRCHRHLAETIVCFGKTFSNSNTRFWRPYDGSATKNALVLGEVLFSGTKILLQLRDAIPLELNGIYLCNGLFLLKRLIFDESRGSAFLQPLFYKSGCHKAFFGLADVFLKHGQAGNLGTALVAWLSLVQRLINTDSVVNKKPEPPRQASPDTFDYAKYLAVCQQSAFECMQPIFDMVMRGDPMASTADGLKFAERVISVYEELVRGVVRLRHLNAASKHETELELFVQQIDMDKAQMLVDMGFPQSDAVEALLQRATVLDAAEYLLSLAAQEEQTARQRQREAAATANANLADGQDQTAPADANPGPSTDQELSSLNEEVSVEMADAPASSENSSPHDHFVQVERMDIDDSQGTSAGNASSAATQTDAATTSSSNEEDEMVPISCAKVLDFKTCIDFIRDTVVPSCLSLLQVDHAAVFSVSELISAFMKEAIVAEWVQKTLVERLLMGELRGLVATVLKEKSEISDSGRKFGSFLHLVCLLWQNFGPRCRLSMLERDFYDQILQLFFALAHDMDGANILLPPILLWIDLYEKEKRVDARQMAYAGNVERLKWSYWVNDDRYGSRSGWRDFGAFRSSQLSKAFRQGKASHRILHGDKFVIVNFLDMTMRHVDSNAPSAQVFAQAQLPESFNIESIFAAERQLRKGTEQHKQILFALLRIIGAKEPTPSAELIYSALLLLLRIVSLEGMAEIFMQQDGIHTLLTIENLDSSGLFLPVITLVLRTCIDSQLKLSQPVQDIVRHISQGMPISTSDFGSRSVLNKLKYRKEWRRVMLQLTPLAVRDPECYVETMRFIARHKNNELVLSDEAATTSADRDRGDIDTTALDMIVNEVVAGLITQEEPTSAKTSLRVLQPCALLHLLAELVRSYPHTTTILTEMRLEKRSTIALLIEKYLLESLDQSDIQIAIKALLLNFTANPQNHKALNLLVAEIKAAVRSITAVSVEATPNTAKAGKTLCSKINALARLVMLIKDSPQQLRYNVTATKQVLTLVRAMHKKNLVVDFANAIRFLPLHEKHGTDTVNIIIWMFEGIARSISQMQAYQQAAANVTRNPDISTRMSTIEGVPPSASSSPALRQGDGAQRSDDSTPAQPPSTSGAVADTSSAGDDQATQCSSAGGGNRELIHALNRVLEQIGESTRGLDDDLDTSIRSVRHEIRELDDDVDYEGTPQAGAHEHLDSDCSRDEDAENSQMDVVDSREDAVDEGDEQMNDVPTSRAEQSNEHNEGVNHLDHSADEANDITQGVDEQDEEDDDEDEESLGADVIDDDAVTLGMSRFGGRDSPIFEVAFPPHYSLSRHAMFSAFSEASESIIDDFELLPPSSSYMGGLLSGYGRDEVASNRRLPHTTQMGFRLPHNLLLDNNVLPRSRREVRDESNALAIQHPLLRRPTARPVENIQPTVGAVGGPDPFAQRTYRSLVGHPGEWRLFGGGFPTARNGTDTHRRGLQRRQGALSYGHGRGAVSDPRLLTHLIDAGPGAVPGGFAFDLGYPEANDERQMVDARIPFLLDRLCDQSRLLDAHSAHYLAIAISAHLTKELEVTKKKKYPKPSETVGAKDDNGAPKWSLADCVQLSANAMASIEATIPASVADAQSAQLNRLDAPPADAGNSAGASSVDTSDLSNRFAVLPGGAKERAEMSSNRRTSQATDATASSSVAAMEASSVVSTQTTTDMEVCSEPRTSSPCESGSSNAARHAQEESFQDQAEAGNTRAPGQIPEEYRNILGDIEIPDGVDAAFLAALPEDIRAEVIRDHIRQQRVQRVTQRTVPQSASADDAPAPPAVDAAAQDGAPAAELDHEFLAALPPELQDEVLAEHEQRIAQHNRQQTAPANDVDPAALFDSLTPSVRAQVLADADDSVLQVLPPNLVAEAARLRANVPRQQQALRFDWMLDRPIHIRRANQPAPRQGLYADAARLTLGMEKGVQMFDRESMVTLFLLYFLDYDKFNLIRFQKLLKVLCLHPGTCDFVIWCLLSILKNLTEEGSEEDMKFSHNGWMDKVQLQTALNQPEKVLKVDDKRVVVQPLARASIATRILDTLIFLARHFPLNFLPLAIRYPQNPPKDLEALPELDHFWAVVRKITKIPQKPKVVKTLPTLKEIVATKLEQAPISVVLQLAGAKTLRNDNKLVDRTLKLMHVITQSIPTTQTQYHLSNESIQWFTDSLREVIHVILEGVCLDEGVKDGRNFIVEVMRAFPGMRADVFGMLYGNIKEQGMQLFETTKVLLDELQRDKVKRNLRSVDSVDHMDENLAGEARPSTSATAATKEDTASDITLKLPTLKEFSARNNQPRRLLKSLETVSYVRNQLKQMERRRRQGMLTSESEETNVRDMLESLQPLWQAVSTLLEELTQSYDSHAVVSLQNAAEAFFLAHAFAIPPKEREQAVPPAASQQPTNAPAEAIDLAELLFGANTAPSADNLTECGDAATAPVGLEPEAPQRTSDVRDAEAWMPDQPISFPMPPMEGITTAAIPWRFTLNKYTRNLLEFAEKHRTVLNQILRGSSNNLMEDSAFAILTYYPKLLDFDVKRKYFYKEIRKLEERGRFRYQDVAVRVRRSHLFSDSFRELFRLRGSEWRTRFYIIFEGEEGQDAGGLLREWFSVITREIFNPNYALFITAPGDRVTYMINKSSYVNPEHLDYFKFVGRIIAKAIYDNKQLDCYFTRAFYKHILNVAVRYQDIESEDPSYFKSLEFLLNNPVEDLDAELSFSVEVEEFGVRSMRQLKENGAKIPVTDENKEEYVKLVCQMKMTGSIRKQLDAFLEGFYDIIPKELISVFNEQELELLVSGLPEIDINDLCNNTDYRTYTRSSPQIQWFWRALRSFEKEDLAKFLQFVTGTSKVPLQGFSHLEGMHGVQKFTIQADVRSTDRLPSAHTCFNQLDLPQYESYEQLRRQLLLACRECEGFAFA